MNYINEKANLLTVKGMPGEQAYRVIHSGKWREILNAIHGDNSPFSTSPFFPKLRPLSVAGYTKQDFETLINMHSKPLTYDMSQLQFTKMDHWVRNHPREHIGYIVFDNSACKLYFEVDETATSTTLESTENYSPGGSFKNRDNTVVITSIHTHPEEKRYRAMGITDQDLFDGQYRTDLPNQLNQDGYSGKRTRVPNYSMGITSVDFYSVSGKQLSKNNLCSNSSLIRGSFNILNHALNEYINYHYY